MNILLKPELEKYIANKMKTGQYPDASAVINDALELLKEQEEFTPEYELHLKREIAKGIEQLDRGEFAEFTAETVIAEQRKKRVERKSDN